MTTESVNKNLGHCLRFLLSFLEISWMLVQGCVLTTSSHNLPVSHRIRCCIRRLIAHRFHLRLKWRCYKPFTFSFWNHFLNTINWVVESTLQDGLTGDRVHDIKEKAILIIPGMFSLVAFWWYFSWTLWCQLQVSLLEFFLFWYSRRIAYEAWNGDDVITQWVVILLYLLDLRQITQFFIHRTTNEWSF